jgi:hypothetical protein
MGRSERVGLRSEDFFLPFPQWEWVHGEQNPRPLSSKNGETKNGETRTGHALRGMWEGAGHSRLLRFPAAAGGEDVVEGDGAGTEEDEGEGEGG